MEVSYLKMHGTGNLIVVVDQREDNVAPPGPEKLRELGDEAIGPGFDQLMWISAATDDTTLASYRVFNSDGSEVQQCGNGVRCVARYLAGDDSHRIHNWQPRRTGWRAYSRRRDRIGQHGLPFIRAG